GRGVVALEDDAGLERPYLRILLAPGGALARVAGSRSGRDLGARRRRTRRCGIGRRRRARRLLCAGAGRGPRGHAHRARRRRAAAQTSPRRSGRRAVHRGAPPRAAGPLPHPRRSAPRHGSPRRVGTLDVRRRRRPRVRRPATQRRLPAPCGAHIGRPLRPRRRGLARRDLAAVVDTPDRLARAPRSLARALGVRADRRPPVGRVDPSAPLGAAMTRRRSVLSLALALWVGGAATAFAGERYALVVTGASGGDV